MDPPPLIDFHPMERIQQIYSELPSLFAKDIARRHQMSIISSLQNTINPPALSTPLKRDRPDEEFNMSMKRRNTGDSNRPPSASMPPPSSIPLSMSTSNNSMSSSTVPISNSMLTLSHPMTNDGLMNGPTTINLNPTSHSNIHTSPTSNASSPPQSRPLQNQIQIQPQTMPSQQLHIPSPHLSEAQLAGLNPGVIGNTAEAQLAASNRERLRQAQIREAQIRAAQAAAAARQMSPSGGMGMGAGGMQPQQRQVQQMQPQQGMMMAGGSGVNPMGGVNGMNANAAAGPSNPGMAGSSAGGAMGGGGGNAGGGGGGAMSNVHLQQQQQQFLNILQTPNHPFLQYMTKMVPGFLGLPLQQQMQKMFIAQVNASVFFRFPAVLTFVRCRVTYGSNSTSSKINSTLSNKWLNSRCSSVTTRSHRCLHIIQCKACRIRLKFQILSQATSSRARFLDMEHTVTLHRPNRQCRNTSSSSNYHHHNNNNITSSAWTPPISV